MHGQKPPTLTKGVQSLQCGLLVFFRHVYLNLAHTPDESAVDLADGFFGEQHLYALRLQQAAQDFGLGRVVQGGDFDEGGVGSRHGESLTQRQVRMQK